MFVVGLTGGIGSGKTAVSDRFAKLGIAVIDADVAARVVVEPGRPALAKIADHFGQETIAAGGELDRAKLRELVFNDEAQRKWLEALLHPLIGTEIINQIQTATSPYALLVSPLLIETSQVQFTQRVLLVDVPVEIQIARTMARDNNNEAQVKAIIASQASREQRLAAADDVINNDRDLEYLEEQVQALHQKYLALAGDEYHDE
ncbi:MAG: dephospho-CoA kinase [Pseudomonadales bacterium]